jgi:lipopolysaccharide biosynthesis glycosyltransferase
MAVGLNHRPALVEAAPAREPIVLVTGGDDRFALGIAVMLHSALQHLPDGDAVRIFLLDGGVSDASKARVNRVLRPARLKVSVEWITPGIDALADLPVTERLRTAAYLRLLMPSVLPEEIDRAIYLDGDVIVERNLRDLWSMDMGDRPALGVENYSSPTVAHPGSLPETYAACGLPPDAPYCNTGVMLLSLRRWRAMDVGAKVIDFTRQYREFNRYADQDGLNAVIGASWGLLDPRWNVQILTILKLGETSPMTDADRRQLQADVLQTGHVLHYAGHLKPWMHTYRRQCGDRFLYYARRSGWFPPLQGLAWTLTRGISQATLFWLANAHKQVLRFARRR